MISKLQITRRPTTKPAMEASSSSWFLLRPVNTFSSFFFNVLSSPHGPPSASELLSVLLPRVRLFLLFFLSFSLPCSLSPRLLSLASPAGVFASVHQRSIHRNYNNNNDKSSNNVLCPREYRWRTAGLETAESGKGEQ